MSEVLVTGEVTATISRMHACSGTTADYTVTLPPAAGNDGKSIGFRMVPGLTKLVTIDGNASETIDGALSRVMWASEAAILYCDGANWFKIVGRSIPMVCAMTQTAGDQTIATATLTKVTVANVADDSAGMGNSASSRIDLKRPGAYLLVGAVTFQGIVTADAVRALVRIMVTGANFANAETFGKMAGLPAPFVSKMKTGLTTSDYIELNCYQNSGVNQTTFGTLGLCFVSAIEIPTW